MISEGTIKKTVAGIIVVFSVFGGFFALTRYFVPYDIFNMSCEATERKLNDANLKQEIRILEQHQLYLEARELNQMQFMRLENDPRKRQVIQDQINDIRKKKEKTEDRIYKLKSK